LKNIFELIREKSDDADGKALALIENATKEILEDQTQEWQTCLFHACMHNRPVLVKALCDKSEAVGTNTLHVACRNGMTALMEASEAGHAECV